MSVSARSTSSTIVLRVDRLSGHFVTAVNGVFHFRPCLVFKFSKFFLYSTRHIESFFDMRGALNVDKK
jgi:hypothetical protein